jgi:hypothetical protein
VCRALFDAAVRQQRWWKITPEFVRLYRRSLAAIAKRRGGIFAQFWRSWKSFNANAWLG